MMIRMTMMIISGSTETETAALIRNLSPPLAYDTTTTTDPGLLPPAVLLCLPLTIVMASGVT